MRRLKAVGGTDVLFSQRKGLKPVRKALQLGAVDDELRNCLWSIVSMTLLGEFRGPRTTYGRRRVVKGSNLEELFVAYWLAYFKSPTDTIPTGIEDAVSTLREYFFSCPWNEVYDFLEFTLLHVPSEIASDFKLACNVILEQENAGYRIVGTEVTGITSDAEIAEIEDALASPVSGANRHLQSALAFLSDRKQPDYRNSIKESVSAVEAICRALTGKPGATLGRALDVLETKVGIHGALKAAFDKLYGYTSDEAGIRHAMLEEPNITFSDAKFMLVSCSAFVNYVVGKAAEANLRFP